MIFLDTAQTQTQLRLPVLRERQFLPHATSMACGRLVLSSRAATRSIPVQVCRFHRVVTCVNLGISRRDVLTDVSFRLKFPHFTVRMPKKLPKRDLPMKKVWVQMPGLIMEWLMHYTSKAGG